MRHDPTFWLLARASGLTAYVMLTLSVLAGLVVKSRPFRSLKPAAVTDLHRILALLGLGALAGHAVALVLDTTVKVSIAGLFIPGLVSYRPVWTSLGILAAELMVLVYASFSVRKRIGNEELAAPALGDATGSSPRRPCTASRAGTDSVAALGIRALRLRRRLRRGRDDLAGSFSPTRPARAASADAERSPRATGESAASAGSAEPRDGAAA